jgi:hypothetical protein
MGDAADGTVYPDASQPQRQSLRQGMDVISVTDFDFFHTSKINNTFEYVIFYLFLCR